MAQVADTNELLDVRDISARYSTNVIASVAFGIDIDCIQDPNCEFRRYGKKIFEMTISNGIRNAFAFLSPTMMSSLRLRLTDKGVEDFMTTVVKQNLEYREQNQIIRKDFFQLLMQLRDSGSIAENDDEWQTNINGNSSRKQDKCLTLQEMTAQSFLFFGAGKYLRVKFDYFLCSDTDDNANNIKMKMYNFISQIFCSSRRQDLKLRQQRSLSVCMNWQDHRIFKVKCTERSMPFYQNIAVN